MIARVRRRSRCIRRGHRLERFEYRQGDMVIAGNACRRCGHRQELAIRPVAH